MNNPLNQIKSSANAIRNDEEARLTAVAATTNILSTVMFVVATKSVSRTLASYVLTSAGLDAVGFGFYRITTQI
jgi:hypothetical protein